MKVALLSCCCIAVAGVAATVIGNGMMRDADCYDPPCGGAKDMLIIYGTVSAVAFGAVAVVLGLVWTLVTLVRRR